MEFIIGVDRLGPGNACYLESKNSLMLYSDERYDELVVQELSQQISHPLLWTVIDQYEINGQTMTKEYLEQYYKNLSEALDFIGINQTNEILLPNNTTISSLPEFVASEQKPLWVKALYNLGFRLTEHPFEDEENIVLPNGDRTYIDNEEESKWFINEMLKFN